MIAPAAPPEAGQAEAPTSPGEATSALSGAYAQVAALLHESRRAAPDALGSFLARRAATLGLADLCVYVSDYEQRRLVPIVGSAEVSSIAMDDTIGGRAFTTARQLHEPAEGGARLWSVVVDGAARLGVMAATFASLDDDARALGDSLAGVVAALLITRGQCTDAYTSLRRTQKITLAAEMQWGLLPPLSLDSGRVSVAGLIQPAYEVGGDCFDYAVNGDTLDFAVFDAMGHGLASSQLAHMAVSSYRHSRRQQLGLADTHAAMDSLLVSQFSDDQFATAQLAELHLGSGELHLLNAGHPAPLLVGRSGQTRALPTVPALPVGIGAGEAPVVTSVTLEPGDRVLFFTDGVVENRLPDGEPLGEERLREAFARECAAGRTASETVRRLSRSSPGLHGGHTRDDATWVLVEWHGNEDSLA